MKTIGISVTSIIIGALGMFFWMSGMKCGSHKKDQMTANQLSAQVKTVIKLQEVPVQHYLDANGIDHASKEEATVSSQAAMLAIKDQMNRLAHQLKIKPSQITGYNTISSIDVDSIIASYDNVIKQKLIHMPDGKVDTVERSFAYEDEFAWISGLVGKKYAQIKYSFGDSLTILSYTKRKWLLGDPETFIDAHLANPNAYIKGMDGIRIDNAVPGQRWSIGPYAGYDVVHGKFGIGIAIQYALIRL